MVLQIQAMYHTIVVKEGTHPGKVVFVGDESTVKQSKAELSRMCEEPYAAPVPLPKEEVCMDTDLWHYMCKVQSHELRNIKSEYNVNITSEESGNITTVSGECVFITVIETLYTYLSKLNTSSIHVLQSRF